MSGSSGSRAVVARLQEMARRARVETIRAVDHAKGGHLGGPLSAADLLVALYFHVMRIRPDEPDWTERDRFILSKGHSAIGLYAVMALRGYFPVSELLTFDADNSRLQGHPDMTRLPGLDMSTGSLGMGISAGVGMALGAKLDGLDSRVYVMVGDGECQEGEIWEGAMVADRYALDNLVVIIDDNRLQQYGWQGDELEHRLPPHRHGQLADKWRAFGWHVIEVDGHDMAQILEAFESASSVKGRPVAIMAETVKGKGVSFMEDRFFWHTRILKPEELAQAMQELGEPEETPVAPGGGA
jgi:transketolase